MTELFTVKKLNLNHELITAYAGQLVERTPESIVLEARFERESVDLGCVVLERHDRFIEHFFTDRWYNIFEIHSVHDDHLKGWYCNITRPAACEGQIIEQVDLALDIWINPDGSYHLLDHDEFAALDLDRATRLRARQAVGELLYLLYHHTSPFTSVDQPRALSARS
jgi:predicted RNA-binding protein associated with RNAse of E/G family